jgi:hypothetical protein
MAAKLGEQAKEKKELLKYLFFSLISCLIFAGLQPGHYEY